MEYRIRMSMSTATRRTRYEQIDLHDTGVVVSDLRIAWHEVASIQRMPWTLFLRDGSTLSIVEGRMKHQPTVASFVGDAAHRIAQWNAQASEEQRIARDIDRELAHVTRQLVGATIGGLIALALLVTTFMIGVPISGVLYLALIATPLFALFYAATMMGKRLTLLALRRKAPSPPEASETS